MEASRLGDISIVVTSSHGDISNVAAWGHYQSRASLLLATLAALLFAADKARTQQDPLPKEYWQRLRIPATARGLIGGESHDSYVIHARKGLIMNVRIFWQPFGDEKYEKHDGAHFYVSGWPSFSFDGQLKGTTRESNHGTRWTAKIPRTGNYYIFVLGYPTVRYILKVTVE